MIAIVLIGQTGSGKTTLARQLETDLGLERISAGDIARDLAKSDTYTRASLEKGDWAPELAMRAEIVARIEAAVIKTSDFVLEGFPRRLEQLYILESIPRVQPIYCVLEVDPLICLRRLAVRQRNGDHPDAVATRWRNYQEYTEPMVEILYNQLVTVDSSDTVDHAAGIVAGIYYTAKREE